MRSTEVCHAWVVYRMTLPKNAIGGNVVCEQREWEIVEARQPGYHTLLHTGLKTEQEAEKLARGMVEQTPALDKQKAAITPLYTTTIPTRAGTQLPLPTEVTPRGRQFRVQRP